MVFAQRLYTFDHALLRLLFDSSIVWNIKMVGEFLIVLLLEGEFN